jgi:EutQ-like cupin domain
MGMERWDQSREPLTEEAVRRLHVPANHYRIAALQYPGHTSFSGATRKGLCYVLHGNCTYRFESGKEIRLAAGDIGRLPEGNYDLEAGDEELSIVMVWELPERFW